MDAVIAYLAGELDMEIYMSPPEGIPNTKGRVCKLKRGLYGLRQSGRLWNRRFTKELRRLGFRPTTADPSVWTRGRDLILVIYVDDVLLIARDSHELRTLKNDLSKAFKMKDLGEVQDVLGLRIRRDRSKRLLWIDQSHYVADILKEFNHLQCKPVSTPADGYANLERQAHGEPYEDIVKYQHALGRLNWLVRGTRPDLTFVIHKLSQFCQQPYAAHWAGVRRVLRYLKGSQDLSLRYKRESQPILTGYSDADFTADTTDRKSTMGYVYTLYGAAVTWGTRKQKSISTSTTEAEYVGLCNAAKEAVWLRTLMKDLGRAEYAGGSQATRLYGDNQGALKLVANPEFHARSKHIDIQYHYVRELAEQGTIAVEYIPTEKMLADCLTKPLNAPRFKANLEQLGLRTS